jgi:hypothetical protein
LTKAEIREGDYYEPVITTIAGLYRLRTNDVIRITALVEDDVWFEVVHTTA